MLFLYLSPGYIKGMGIWLAVLLIAFYALLRYRRWCRLKSRRLLPANAGLSLAMLLAVVTAVELGFACFADFSDTFNVTNISKRWLLIHHDAEKNNQGYRDPNRFDKYVSPGQQRIIFLGDSFTAGHGIRRMQDRFTDQIGEWLERKQPGKFVVANLGEPGVEVSQVVGLAEAVVYLMKADVSMFVYIYNLNDIEGYDPQMTPLREETYAAQPKFFLLRDTYFLNWLYLRYVQFNSPGMKLYFPRLAEAYQTKAWDGVREKLLELKRVSGESHVDFRMVVFPFMQDLGPDYPFRAAHTKVVDFCKAEKIPVLDLEPTFRGHAGENLRVSRFDSHPNERAHAIAAEAIETGLLADLVRPAQP